MNSSEQLELEDWNMTEFETPLFILEMEIIPKPLMITIYSVLIAVATIGNVAVVFNLIRLKKLKGRLTGVDKLVLNLAIADLFVAFISLPDRIAVTITSSWELGNFLCKALSFFHPFGVYLSGFTVACISVERCLAFASSGLHSQKDERRVKIMIVLAWSCAIIASSPQVFMYSVHETTTINICAAMVDALSTAYAIGELVLYHVLPLVTILTCYSVILLRLRQLKQVAPSSSAAMMNRLSSNVFRMSLMISLTFFCCWAPYCIVTLWYTIHPSSMFQLLPANTLLCFLAFAYTNACANPIVYGFFQLRKRHGRSEGSEDENFADKTVVWSELNLHET